MSAMIIAVVTVMSGGTTMATLRNLRRRQLLSQRDLAQKAGVTASTVYLIETGRTEPRLKIMRQLCEALNVHPMEVDEFRSVLEVESEPAARRQAA
jgi:DNA-binding XRE family transcriptional regulator